MKSRIGNTSLFFESLNLLKTHSEFDIAFLYGHRLDEIPLLKRDAKIWKCLVAIPFFVYMVLSKTSLRKSRSDAEVLFFAETLNQFNALVSCREELRKVCISCHLLVTDDLKNVRECEAQTVTYSLTVAIVALMLMVVRMPYVILYCLKDGKNGLRFAYLHKIIGCYAYIPYFLDYLKRNKPQAIVVSNDHNPICRSLQFAAKFLGIKNFYLQHSSVSSLFPKLICDWALLDGRDSLEKYLSVLPYNGSALARNETQIVLSGLKKHIEVKKKSEESSLFIGVACNKLDSIERLARLVAILDEKNIGCIIRLHPGIDKLNIGLINKELSSYSGVYVESAKDVALGDFLSRIDFMIAGESGIHLEALLAGVQSYYFLLDSKNTTFDYYSFIKNGLISELKNIESVSRDQIYTMKNISDSQKRAVQYYSETYGTPWMGKEGQLAALTIKCVLKDTPFELLKEMENSSSSLKVYELDRANR